MFGGDHEDELVLPHRLNRQRSFGRRFPRRADHQVGAPGHQRVPASTENFGRYFDARAGTFPVKVLQDGKEALGGNDVFNGDAQLRFPASRDALDPALQVGGGAQQVAAFAQQFLTGFRQLGTVAAAVEKLHFQVLLELLDGVGDRRRNTVQFLAGGGETAIACDRVQDQQRVERDSHGEGR